jgi:hypothetical protein
MTYLSRLLRSAGFPLAAEACFPGQKATDFQQECFHQYHSAGAFFLRDKFLFITKQLRRVAQPGSAPALGAGGRRFKSGLSDQHSATSTDGQMCSKMEL